jgi:HAD superfamily hydrolase (TIGR01509 family)
MKKAIIFDLWNTLLEKEISTSKTLQKHFAISSGHDFMKKYEDATQRSVWKNEEDVACSFLSSFGIEKTKENIDAYIDIIKRGNRAIMFEGMHELLLSLKEKGYKLAILSNTSVFESSIVKDLDIEKLFDVVAFSWQTGYLKPSIEAFDHAISLLGVSREGVVFVDDTLINITLANSYGISSIQFESVKELENDFKEKGVL